MQYIMHAYNTPDNLVRYNAHLWCEDVRRVIWSFVLKKHCGLHHGQMLSFLFFIKSHWSSLKKKRYRGLQFTQKQHTNIWKLEKTPLIYFHFLMTSAKWKKPFKERMTDSADTLLPLVCFSFSESINVI